MTATAETTFYNPVETLYPADPEVFTALLDHYGFDYFLKKTLPRIDMTKQNYRDAVDTAIDRYNRSLDASKFSVKKIFGLLVTELMEEGRTKIEAFEELAEEEYKIPVDMALFYSADAGDDDIERLSRLIRNRAQRLLEKGQV